MEIKHFTCNILKRMPKNLSKEEQTRYVYISLGRLFSFDEEYWLGNSKTRRSIYRNAMGKNIDFHNIKKGQREICVSIARTYIDVLNELGIHSELYQEDPKDPHVYSIVLLNGKVYMADLQRDLEYIQTKRRTKYFGKEVYTGKEGIQSSIVTQMDKKLGYSYEGDAYVRNKARTFEMEFEYEESLEKKIQKIFSIVRNAPGVLEMGHIEQLKYIEDVFDRLLTSKEGRKILINDLYFVGKDAKKTYLMMISILLKDNKFARYIYHSKSGAYKKFEDEEIFELLKKGTIKLAPRQKVPGLIREMKRKEDDR